MTTPVVGAIHSYQVEAPPGTPPWFGSPGSVVASMFDTRENAMRANDQVVGIMRERAPEVAPNPPRVTAGEAVVSAAA